MTNIVEVVALSKVFTDFWGRPKVKAVQELNIEIQQGEIFGLLGPNGSGKSTTIKLLLGLLKPTQGQIAIFGQKPKSQFIKKNIGFLPEETYLYPFLTAEETLHFFGGLFGLSKEVSRERADVLLKLVGLDHARFRLLGEFSKGMLRRVGLAQALMGDPQFLILDEPTSGLDPIGILEMKELLFDLKSKGKTILLSSHMLAEVQDVCDRVCILFGGKVCSYGRLDELLTNKNAIKLEFSHITDDKIKLVSDWLSAQKFSFAIEPAKENLESYFMRVVSEQESSLTSGSVKGVALSKGNGFEIRLEDLVQTDEKVAKDTVIEEKTSQELKELLPLETEHQEPKINNDIDQSLLKELTQNKQNNQS